MTLSPHITHEMMMKDDASRTAKDVGIICRTLEAIDDRAICADGPVTPTLREATHEELRRIYSAAKRIQKRYRGRR